MNELIDDQAVKELDVFFQKNLFTVHMAFAANSIILTFEPDQPIDGMIFDKIYELGFKITGSSVIDHRMYLTIFKRLS